MSVEKSAVAIGQGSAQLSAPVRRERRWLPEQSDEIAAALRKLCVSPWLIAGRNDVAMGAVRRNFVAIREILSRLGWVVVIEKDFIRLTKSPPVRRDAWAAEAPTSLQASWFFLIAAAAESVAPRVALSQLVVAARAAAAEAQLEVTHDIVERRAIVRALRMLDTRGIVMQVDGDVEGFVENEDAPVLLGVYHARLAHLIAHFGAGDPVGDPRAWLEHVENEPDPARRMRRRLVDDTVIHVGDLDEAEADWLSRRVRGDDGAPLAAAFGLRLERRLEGAAFVVPTDAFRFLHELGPTPFPAPGTVAHAALLLGDHAAQVGTVSSGAEGPGPGWRGLGDEPVRRKLATLAAERADGPGGWRHDLVEDPSRLVAEVKAMLTGLDLVRVRATESGLTNWWFSPALGRWTPPTAFENDDRTPVIANGKGAAE
jgi:uncharacterized protein (TIGR02678 family)